MMDKIVKLKCKECGNKQFVNPWFSNWQCNKCKTHWVDKNKAKEVLNG